MRIELSQEEAGLLAGILETHKKSLLVEIRHTWSGEYKQRLRQEETLIERMLAELTPSPDEARTGT